VKAEQLKNRKYLRVVDIPADGLVVTIKDADVESIKSKDGSSADKGVLALSDGYKPFVLNSTNVDKLIELYGDETDDWIGKQISIVTPTVEAFGKQQPALRIAELPATDKKKKKKASAARPGSDPTWES
jgi:hypothetical protein